MWAVLPFSGAGGGEAVVNIFINSCGVDCRGQVICQVDTKEFGGADSLSRYGDDKQPLSLSFSPHLGGGCANWTTAFNPAPRSYIQSRHRF